MRESAHAVNIAGGLTLHGITRTQQIVCQLAVNGDTIRGLGEFMIRQTDYGIKRVSVAAGELTVNDELKCSFDVVGRKET